ncbi:RUN domain-containing protein 1 isoform X2 [Folsomia candida]|uniref:RUN domain-containing protein 1 isoform X2 n=1 Tax=Folsomia candida TaxID=158441 RepID=UPI000B8F8F83|nr:RUN domain-containing protein 1 isoform X2 [Folsomia candida]
MTSEPGEKVVSSSSLHLESLAISTEEDGDLEEEEEWNDWEGTKSRPERWAPLGANDSDIERYDDYKYDNSSPTKFGGEDDLTDPIEIRKMKENHEQLTSALLALTTHFAQVQFRIQQIVSAPVKEKEHLLRDLEEFTFRGIPSAVSTVNIGTMNLSCHPDDIKGKIELQKEQQKDLIGQLKTQLEELESYAYETGDAGLPQSVLLEHHKIVVDQLREKLNFNVDELGRVSGDDLRSHVDQAIDELVGPIKMKEQLVDQLKTQISDLERFIQYLHGEATCTCDCPKSSKSGSGSESGESNSNSKPKCTHYRDEDEEEIRTKTVQMMKKALTLIQMFAVAQFGCSSNQFDMNSLKKSPKGNHWGDLRAALEMAVARVYNLALQSDLPADSDYTSDCEETSTVVSVICNQVLTSAVRKDLATALGNLLEHGLMHVGQSQGLLSLANCFSSRSSAGSGFLTAWDLILKYYSIKNGEKYNATAARKLSQSFALEIVGSTAITNKQLLLSTIDNIISSHSRYKRSPESHFKAFICAALNCKKLVIWIRLIVRTQEIMEQYYQPWSYVNKMGFEDALRSLDKLSSINFDLPVDLAIRQFQNIKDAFQ